ncbi:MAG TPA: ATP-binding protein [Tepidisphaeraceae bacterium]|nr:ATP-binding protein [Tepidisphaeraceae bacterium]
MDIPPGRLLRRLVIPQMLLALGAVGIVAVVAIATRENQGSSLTAIIVTACIAWALSCAGLAAVAHHYATRQVLDIAQTFRRALPAPIADVVRVPDHDALEQLAAAFGELIAQSREDQAQLRTIISSMTDALLATDHRQRILLSNEAATDMLGVPRDAKGKALWEVLPAEEILGAVAEVSLTGQRKTVSVAFRDGKQLEVTACRLPLRPAGFIVIAHDVTEAARYEELRKEFVANVSHELRTPLTLISGFVETLRDGAFDDPERARQYLATVQKHSEQLANLIEDLLSLSRLESDSKLRNPRVLRLPALVEKVRELLLPAAQKKNQHLSVEVRGDPPPALADVADLERAISNLLDNAIKYTPEGGTIRIVVSTQDRDPLVQVIDSGVGIPAGDLPRVFERFYRVDRSRSREMGGTGLGLSIVKHVVQRHGGTIEAASTPGAGSCFTIRLPASLAEQSTDG